MCDVVLGIEISATYMENGLGSTKGSIQLENAKISMKPFGKVGNKSNPKTYFPRNNLESISTDEATK